jgi:XTP/dITP diphosphohydrolase
MFYPKGYSESFAELNSLEKNKISHRGQALKKLMDKLNKT